jgi:hypothetical protein
VADRGGAARTAWLFVALLMSLLLVLVAAVDLDGDPLTFNIPDAVLVAQVEAPDAAESDAERCHDAPPVSRQLARRVVDYVRRAERWTLLLRRFHRSVLADIPI